MKSELTFKQMYDILNLIDEVENNLIEKDEAYKFACRIKENCNSYPIRSLLEYWIDYFIH